MLRNCPGFKAIYIKKRFKICVERFYFRINDKTNVGISNQEIFQHFQIYMAQINVQIHMAIFNIKLFLAGRNNPLIKLPLGAVKYHVE